MKKKHLFPLLILVSFLSSSADSKAQIIVQVQQGKPTNIRGLSVVDDSVAWISGSKGYIAITRDGGKNWSWQQVKGFEELISRILKHFQTKKLL